ncbi:hypothetical protein HanPSC8_Chr01g0035281 [Helianthus annuus]|nr:hypothetical protein HanPSC8_Chr01g0035281 [Helianthus annuus]
MMMDGLTTCCPFSGVSGSSVMEVTPRQSIAYVALTGIGCCSGTGIPISATNGPSSCRRKTMRLNV